MAESIESFDGNQEYIENIDIKIGYLKAHIKKNKSELNVKFQDFIISVLKRKENIESQMDETLLLAITQSTEMKMKMARLSGAKEVSEQCKLQPEIQIEKLKDIQIPEISLEWDIDGLQQQLDNVCKVVTTNHPYAYLGSDMKPVDCKVDLKSEPKSFEIDPINGDVYFLCNKVEDDKPDFKIFAVNRFGKQKWDNITLERKFCPIRLCIGENNFFVSCSSSSHRSKILSLVKLKTLPENTEFHDYILVMEKQSGKIVKDVPIPGLQEIGPISFEPKSKRVFLLTKTKDLPYLSIFDSDGNMEEKRIELKRNRQGYILAAPEIRKIEITQDKIVVFGVNYIDFFDFEGKLLHTFTKSTGLITVDPWLNILKLDKITSEIIISTKEGEPLTKCVLKKEFTPIDLKYDISSGRIIVLCLSRLIRLVYL